MTKRRDDRERTETEGAIHEPRQKSPPRKPRVKRLPRSMLDPRHNPDAALSAIKATLQAGGTTVTEADFNERRRYGFVGQIPSENIVTVRGDQRRYRSTEVKTGPGKAESIAERMIAEAETAFARSVNEIDRILAFEAGKAAASKVAGVNRTRAARSISARVNDLFDASTLAPHNRAAAIARILTQEGKPISVRRVREILALRRQPKYL